MKADSFYFYENNDEMKKPKEIIALEKLYNIQLQQTFYKDDILNVDRNNLFLLDKKENVLGLNLSGNKIDEIKGFEDVKEVLYLNFYNNSLKVIENLQHLRKLEILILSNNKIVKLNEISNPNLKILNLTSNQITKIIGLEKLKNLEEIYFTLNHIKEIKNFENLRNLKVLKIDFNDLAALDFKAFCNCNLKYLDLRNNWINKLMNLEFVKEIEHLNLKYNHINEVQIIKEILNFKNLNYINVEGNPFLNNTNLELRGYGYENHVDDLRQYFHSQC